MTADRTREMSTVDFSRSQAPIGAAVASFNSGLVARGPHVPPIGPAERDPDRVVDVARRDLVVADESRQDRQPGRIRAGPGRGRSTRSSAGRRPRRTRPFQAVPPPFGYAA